ncbi:MAG TPA: lantibiotic dehydratase [Kofleriaceae bacterium]|nr:lantibiotic dehydratase [Kofleriaceae bacterium]
MRGGRDRRGAGEAPGAIETRVQPQLDDAGFFLLRTAALPCDALVSWSADLGAGQASELEAAVAADRALLRRRLLAIIGAPEVAEALRVASPDLVASLPHWLDDPDGERGAKVERALVRYLARMSGRATPFGLFAAVSAGEITDSGGVALEVGEASRVSRLDAAYLHRLARHLVGAVEVRWTASSTLFSLLGEHRWQRWSEAGGMRVYAGAARACETAVDAVLARANGATRAELAAACAAAGGADCERLVDELIAGQALEADLEPPITGPEPLDWLVHRLGGDVGRDLERVAGALADADRAPVGDAAARAALDESVRRLPLAAKDPVQVELRGAARVARIDRSIAAALGRGVEVLARLAGPGPDPLARFRESWRRRFEDFESPRFVPLVDALDPDSGIGLDGPQGRPSSWLTGLGLPRAAPPAVSWSARDRMLLDRLLDAAASGAREIALDDGDLAALPPGPELPDSLTAIATLVPAGDDGAGLRIVLHHARGPSALRLIGRFAGDRAIRPWAEELAWREQTADPDALFAEIAHVPAGPPTLMLSLQQRPLLRGHEIAFAGRSGAEPERQIPLSDLLVTVVGGVGGGRTILWSRRLDRRIVPRLASAHRYEYRDTHAPYYRFLNAVQNEGIAPPYLAWTWGPLAARFTPRVRHGPVVLALAEWRLSGDEVAGLDRPGAAGQMRAVGQLREVRGLPRWVSLVDTDRPDNVLLVDLENSLCVDSLVQKVRAGTAVLREVLPVVEEQVVRGPGGGYAHEIAVPFLRSGSGSGAFSGTGTGTGVGSGMGSGSGSPEARGLRSEASPGSSSPEARGLRSEASLRRFFPPGSEWLSLVVEMAPVHMDRLLVGELAPVARRARADGDAESWFFLRLSFPVPQLRVRLQGRPAALAHVRDRLDQAIGRAADRIWRASYTTYEPEVERYGGAAGMAAAHRLFEADSDAVVELLAGLDDLADEPVRWELALAGMDRLLADLDFSPAAKLAILERIAARWRAEFAVDAAAEEHLRSRFRRDRVRLEQLLGGAAPANPALRHGLAALDRRSPRSAAAGVELRDLAAAGALTAPPELLAESFLHMHAIRMSVRYSRRHELIVYELLRRLYRSQVARGRP